MSAAPWIAVDWGTSNMRAWRLSGTRVVDRVDSDKGMGALPRSGFEPELLKTLGGVPEGPVIVCGMAGSRQGWTEAPYRSAPCTPLDAASAVMVETDQDGLDVAILPGVSQREPFDVMRGEETQVAGFLALNPGFDGVICLPGTHSKWVHVSAGEIVSFRTFMTGEIFALLSRHSVLRHSVGADGWEEAAFLGALDRAMERPAAIAADLFALRAEALLADLAQDAARARLSGLLIGLELAGAKPYWLGQSVAILGATTLAQAYRTALEAQSVPVVLADAERMTLEGLKSAFRARYGGTP